MKRQRPRGWWKKRARRAAIGAASAIVFGVGAWLALDRLFPFPMERIRDVPRTHLVTARGGEIILAESGRDGQQRVPVELSRMSRWLLLATIAAEDQRFRSHPGIDLFAMARAAVQDLWHRSIISGASTLTMQICRMAEPRSRTIAAKLAQTFRALQLEGRLSKDDILCAYLNAAPYGGNTRGVEAAAQRYWGKHAANLSLDEAALLAGLPQSPERLRPDRHPAVAKARRDWILGRMRELGMITGDESAVAAAASIDIVPPHRRTSTPQVGYAALARRPLGGETTIDWPLQREIERLMSDRAAALPFRTQIAAVLINIETAEIRAWIGSARANDPISGQVDGVLAWRSPGSALKPFIYAAAFDAGRLAPDSDLMDAPINRAGWLPHDFEPRFVGKIRADDALRRSLNVPAILVAEAVGTARCAGVLRSVGIGLSSEAADRAGLALVVGGAEVSLLDLTNAYATLGRGGIRRLPKLFADEASPPGEALSRAACRAVDEILSSSRRRPKGLAGDSIGWFMWKTGTSSGRRDALALGHNGRFAVGVWVGRFSGSGSHDFVGRDAAEPLLAGIFNLPGIRRVDPPPAPPALRVTSPFPPPPEIDSSLHILSPEPGARFLAADRAAIVYAEANRTAPVYWFLNGALVGREPRLRLTPPPGRYELRCCDAAGEVDRVEFVVSRS